MRDGGNIKNCMMNLLSALVPGVEIAIVQVGALFLFFHNENSSPIKGRTLLK